MAEYKAKSIKSLNFELIRDENLIGKLSYKSWFRFDALVVMTNNKSYEVAPKGFWGTTIELKDQDKVLLKFSLHWNGEIVIQTYFNEIEKDYILKHRGLFKDSFVLTDREKTELLVMKPHIKWTSMNYEYELSSAEHFESVPEKELLLMISIHCANYYMTMMMGTM